MATVLLVEDDPLQAYLHKSILEASFSDVQRVADAAEALCLVEQQSFALNLGLIVSGHQMAGIGGPAFVAELQIRMPWLPVLVLGYGCDVPADYDGKWVRFLASPFASGELLHLAGQMLALGQRNAA